MKINFLIYSTSFLFMMNFAFGITWREQAQRSQKLSGNIGDFQSIGNDIRTKKYSFGVYSTFTILPKINTKVGSKEEDFESPPVHLIPMIQMGKSILRKKRHKISFKLFGGLLPSFLSKIDSNKQEIKQWITGIEMSYARPIFKLKYKLFIPLGIQISKFKATGALASSNGGDIFKATSRSYYLGIGLERRKYKIFTSFIYGIKNVDTELFINEDKTTLKFNDKLKDSDVKGFLQGSFGFRYKRWTFAFSELWVPSRIMTPRVSVLYEKLF